MSDDYDAFEPSATYMSDESCDAFDQPELDKITEEVGQELGSLASNREGIKKQMFDSIVKFRNNGKNGIRKLAQLKTVFYLWILFDIFPELRTLLPLLNFKLDHVHSIP